MKTKSHIKSLEKKYGLSEKTIYNKAKSLNISLKNANDEELKLLEDTLRESSDLNKKNKKLINSSKKAISKYYSLEEGDLSTLEKLYEDTKKEYEYNENLIINLQKQINDLPSLLQEHRNGSISVNTLINTLKEYTKNNKGLRDQLLELDSKVKDHNFWNDRESPIDDY